MKQSKNLVRSQNFRVHILTPVHIGNGMTKIRGIDFLSKPTSTTIFNMKEIIAAAGKNLHLVSSLTKSSDGPDLNELITQLPDDGKYYKVHGIRCRSNEIRECIRDGKGKPYIPGSSIKGAIRTALLSIFFRRLSSEKQQKYIKNITKSKQKHPSSQILGEIFGKKPNNDLMRSIQITDAYFSEEDTTIMRVKVMSLNHNKTWQWKRNMEIYPEMVRMKATSSVRLNIDEFILSKKDELNLKNAENLPKTYTELRSIINRHSQKIIDGELEFYKNCQQTDELATIINVYKKLKQYSLGDIILMRLGGGIGWRSITGDYISEMDEIRRMYQLGRIGFPFPKSRKIIVSKEIPALPMGWIYLKKQGD